MKLCREVYDEGAGAAEYYSRNVRENINDGRAEGAEREARQVRVTLHAEVRRAPLAN